jgi:hypothetical protein
LKDVLIDPKLDFGLCHDVHGGSLILNSRKMHSTVVYQGKVYIFGGKSKGKYLNDLLSVDLETNEIKHVQALGNPPSPRAGHSSVFFQDRMFVCI